MYGGFDCTAGWAWKADARSALNGPAGAVALTLTKQGDGAKVQGFAITAASATVKGGSSIAVVVEDVAAAAFLSCEVTAGEGMAGQDGVTPGGLATKGEDAPLPDAAAMNACINPASLVGGAAGRTTCDDGMTAGGMGSKGGITGTMSGNGQKGVDGTPADAASGKGGAGEDAINLTCVDGIKGKSGTPGAAGAAAFSPGALSVTGLSDTDATDGKPGTPRRDFGRWSPGFQPRVGDSSATRLAVSSLPHGEALRFTRRIPWKQTSNHRRKVPALNRHQQRGGTMSKSDHGPANTHVTARLAKAKIARVDALIRRCSTPWHKGTRSDVLRFLMIQRLLDEG